MSKAGAVISTLMIILLLTSINPQASHARFSYSEGLKKARQQAEAGEYAAAELTLKRLAQRYPANPEIEAAIGRIRYWQRDYKESARFLRKSLARKEDPSVRDLLARVEAEQSIAEADRFSSRGDTAAAIAILEGLFRHNRLAYESGSRLGQLYVRTAQPDKARDVYLHLTKAYPAEADFALLAAKAAADSGATALALKELTAMPKGWQERNDVILLKARLLTAAGRINDAAALMDNSPQTAVTPALSAARSRMASLARLQEADALMAAGRHAEAAKLLEPLWLERSARYEAGTRLGRVYFAVADYEHAYETYEALAAEYPQEADFKRLAIEALAARGETVKALELLGALPASAETEALRGRLLYRQGNPAEAVKAFKASLAVAESVEVRNELNKAETAFLLSNADRLASGGDKAGAIDIWRNLDETGRDTYIAGYRLGMAAISRRDYPEACRLFARLSSRYPGEEGFRHLYLESLILNKEVAAAKQLIDDFSAAERKRLADVRPDLLYRLRRNNFRLYGGEYQYSRGVPTEQTYGFTMTQKNGQVTGVLSANRSTRFGLSDTQIGLELHSVLGRHNRSGYLAATFSPDPSFSSRYSIGGEYSQPVGGIESSIALFRLSFRTKDAHILIPGITVYPAETFSLNERIYFVIDTGAMTSLTTLGWEPDHRFRSSLAIGLGNAAERLSSSQDTSRYFTFTSRLSGEYRLTPAISVGSDLVHERRQGFYTRNGATLFARYWW